MDDTRIDAAPTPAHVFAYRAFRSVFVGSPESSPVRPQPTETHHANDNKENAHQFAARGSRFQTSPVRGKRDAELASETLNLSLTPKRQRVNSVSPTKSILKKPNVPTPRRASLRDVTVTFKDVKMSASPELARWGSPTKVRSQPGQKTTLATLSSVAISAPTSKTIPTDRAERTKKVDKKEVAAQSTADFDLDSYIAQTEKEMRRLIKYGQKWREHARKQDNENAKLRALLEEVQAENERLKQIGDAPLEDAGPPKSTKIANPSTAATSGTTAPKPSVKAINMKGQSRRVEIEKWKIPLDNVNIKEERSRTISMPEKAQKPQKIQLDTSKDKDESHMQTESKRNPNKGSDNEPPQHKESDQLLKEQVTRKKYDRNSVEHAPESSKPVEPISEGDRKAAARERLRLKREAKVGSVRTSSAPVSQLPNFGHDSKVDNEESQVDWMAMV